LSSPCSSSRGKQAGTPQGHFTHGGMYRDTPLDTQTGYLASVLGLMGIKSIDTIFAEGLNMGDETRKKSLAEAMVDVGNLVSGEPARIEHAVA